MGAAAMLARDELVRFYRQHRNEDVLSLYLDAEEHDPAKRRAWRVTLERVVAQATAGAGDAPQRDACERAFGHLDRELKAFGAFLPGRGWAGFATAKDLLYAESLPVSMPNLARWKPGPAVAPYVRVLAQATPVVTVLVDKRQVRVFRSLQGAFEELQGIDADTFFGDLSDNVNMSKRGTTHTGVRGESDTDVANRIERVGAERLLKHLVEVVRECAGPDGTVVVGGPPAMTAAAMQRLSKSTQDRIIADSTIDFFSTPAELKRATETAAAAVAARLQERLVDQAIDLTGAGGRACLGREATERALEQRRVEVLLMSRRLTDAEPDYAERCMVAALEQDAAVEDLVAAGAERLDHAGAGIGARLRFTA
jgi:hypothetical protein